VGSGVWYWRGRGVVSVRSGLGLDNDNDRVLEWRAERGEVRSEIRMEDGILDV
jgi:hypothetical protein